MSSYGNVNYLPIAVSSNSQTYRLEKVSDVLEYHGYAKAGTLVGATTGWMIQKVVIDSAGDITSITYPNGSASYAYEWDERGSYTYS